jgi:hypothetical protein
MEACSGTTPLFVLRSISADAARRFRRYTIRNHAKLIASSMSPSATSTPHLAFAPEESPLDIFVFAVLELESVVLVEEAAVLLAFCATPIIFVIAGQSCAVTTDRRRMQLELDVCR